MFGDVLFSWEKAICLQKIVGEINQKEKLRNKRLSLGPNPVKGVSSFLSGSYKKFTTWET